MATSFLMGRIGEGIVRRWLQKNGFWVIDTRDINRGSAPMMEGIKNHVLPDLQSCGSGSSRWVEVKTKTRGTFNQKRGRWETGCDKDNWFAYLEVEKITGITRVHGVRAFERIPNN